MSARTSSVIDSPIGLLEIVADDGAIVAIHFDADPATLAAGRRTSVIGWAEEQLARYFTGERVDFTLPLAPRGTEFQRRVWSQLARIEWGTTTSYGAVAHALGLPPGASRAVGAANGANPIPIVVPCHRVIGADGSLTGYAGGLARKQTLLEVEGWVSPPEQPALF